MEVRTTTARRSSAHFFARELRFGLFLVLGMVACVVVLRAAGEGDAPSRIEIEFEPYGDLRWDRGRQPVLQVTPRTWRRLDFPGSEILRQLRCGDRSPSREPRPFSSHAGSPRESSGGDPER